MEVPHYTIRQMKAEEIPAVLDLWKETDLSEGTHSLHTFYEYDPEGFFVAVTDDGTVIGSCAGVKQTEGVYFMGLYAVRSAYRGRGIGLKIWNAVTARIGDESNIGVNPVPAQLANYRDRSGLPTQTEWATFVGVVPALVASSDSPSSPQEEVRVSALHAGEWSRAAAYDARVLGFWRGELVRISCAQPESVTALAERGDGVVCGYGSVKADIRGRALLGPLYADDARVAEALLRELAAHFPSRPLEIMVVGRNAEALSMAQRLGFIFGEAIGRLYRKEEVHVDYQKVFSQHNLNFCLF